MSYLVGNQNSGGYSEKPFSKIRKIITEMVEEGQKKHHTAVLVEFDVTKGKKIIESLWQRKNKSLSFTGWIIKCISQAVEEHKHVQSMRKRDKIIVFDDVDISFAAEKNQENDCFPIIAVVRKANRKNVEEISSEVHRVKLQAQIVGSEKTAFFPALNFLPNSQFLRKIFFWRKIRYDPFFAKKYFGTVGLSSVGMFIKNKSLWAIPASPNSLFFALGGISAKPKIGENGMNSHQYLSATVLFDHDLIDGAMATRFVSRLAELIEKGFGLED